MGGPIPWTAVNSYAQRYEMDEEEFEDLLYHVRALDNAILKRESDKAKAATKK